MTELIVCLGSGKGTWAHLAKLVAAEEWDKVYLVCDPFYSGKFTIEKEHEYLDVDIKKPLKELSEDTRKILSSKIRGVEVGLNLISGTGKEHMALISAVLKLGLGIRFVAFTGAKAEEL